MSDLSKYTQQTYRVYPYEGALFVQDKMEFQGLIANVGLRFDFYNFNYNYYSDIFNPLEYTSPDAAPKSKTKPFGRLQPRLGVSFPVTDRTVFHFNYGTFVQRPAFSYIYGGKIGFTGTTYTLSGIGNSTLKPEKTSAWDVGIVYALPGGVRIDLSAYYKDVSDLVEQATYQSLYPVVPSFTNYTNIDYATIKGFTINIDKNTQSFNFHLNYNYGISKGKSSGPTGQPIHIYRTATNFDSVALNTGVGTRDILLDYDRTHRLLTTMGFRTSNETGPSFLSLRPLSNINVSLTFTYNSGRPYSDPSGGDLTMFNLRSPDYYDLKIRVQKSFMIGSVKYILYVEGYNLTNFQGYSYSNIFDQKNMQDALLRWNNGERGSLEWYNPQYRESADREIASKEQYLYNVANAMYNNQPRYFRVGLSLEL
jgi:outer membrane receptor protein involved in Fe transport